jgi:hypothetical protein
MGDQVPGEGALNIAQAMEGPPALPDGYYQVEVASVELRDNVAGKKAFLLWKLNVTQGEYAGKPQMFRTYLTQAALWRFARTLVALGVSEEQLKQFTNVTAVTCAEMAKQVIGAVAVASIKSRMIQQTAADGTATSRTVSDVDQLLPPEALVTPADAAKGIAPIA